MSFDLYFFRLKQGATLEDAVDFLHSDVEDEDEAEIEDEEVEENVLGEDDEEEESEDEGNEGGEHVETPFDPTLDMFDLTQLVARPYLKMLYSPEELAKDEAVKHFMETDDEADEELLIDLANEFEWMSIDVDGVWMLGFAYGDQLTSLTDTLTTVVETLAPQGIHVYDPQGDVVLTPGEVGEQLRKSMEESQAWAAEVMRQLTEGEEEEEDEDGDEDGEAEEGEDEEEIEGGEEPTKS